MFQGRGIKSGGANEGWTIYARYSKRCVMCMDLEGEKVVTRTYDFRWFLGEVSDPTATTILEASEDTNTFVVYKSTTKDQFVIALK